MKKLHAESQAFNMEPSIINQLGDFQNLIPCHKA